MKFDFIKSLIVLLIALLYGYGLYSISDYDSLRWLVTIVGAALFAVEGILTFGISLYEERKSMMFNVLAAVVLFATLIINLIFACCDFSVPFFIISNGVLLLLYAMCAVSLYRTQK